MPGLTLQRATVIADTALARGRQGGMLPLTVVVLDAGGQIARPTGENAATHGARHLKVAERLALEQRRHANVAVGDHAHHSRRAIARTDGHRAAVIVPHQLCDALERVVGRAVLDVSRHQLLDLHF